MTRDVVVAASYALAPGADGRVLGFDPVAAGVPRKHLKTMTRAVQLGLAAARAAIAAWPAWADVPPLRRGMYVAASPQSGEADDLAPALSAMGGAHDLGVFAAQAVPLIPPLWLVKGLSNNVLGYASAHHDIQGDNGNWCDGALGGAVALHQAVWAVAEGRVDVAVVGGSDALVGAEAIVGGPCGEGAAFFVLVPGSAVGRAVRVVGPPQEPPPGDRALGAATVPLGFAAALGVSAPFRLAGLAVD